MKVVIAQDIGFCLGVRQAVETVERTLNEGPWPVQVLGSLIHNHQVIRSLETRGVRMIREPGEAESGTLVLPSHGSPPDTGSGMGRLGVKVIDATCPLVARAQAAARRLDEAGYQVVLVGDRGHAEVVAIAAWTGGRAVVVRDESEVPQVPGTGPVGIVAQTTQRSEVVEGVARRLGEAGREVKVEDTLCPITRRRQQEAGELAKKVDLVLVVGGRDSANTRRLVEVVRETGVPAHAIETASDLDPRWLDGVDRVGVTAGASTPDWAIEEVLGRMRQIEEAAENQAGKEAGELQATSGEREQSDQPPAAEHEPSGSEAVPMFDRGQFVQGRVMAIDGTDVLIDVGGKSEGVITSSELAGRPIADPSSIVNVGDLIAVVVLGTDEKDGTLHLSKRLADVELAWQRLESAFQQGGIIEAPVTAQVKGGLVTDVGVRGFIPSSQVALSFVRDLKPYVGRTLQLKLLELDRAERRVILSARAVLEEEQARRDAEVWGKLREGEIVPGTVKRLTDFGAFVDIGGVDGLLHVSELSWQRVVHPRDVVQEGQEVKCKILRLDPERKRISLGLKQLEGDPWQDVEQRYPVGSIVEGSVVSLASFGAFVQLEQGVEGLVHLSELSDRRVERADQVVAMGDRLRVKVLKVNRAQKRLSLSRKEADQEIERAALRKYMAQQKQTERVTLGEVFGDLFNGREGAKADGGEPASPADTPQDPERD
ncbi:MAG TPA: bifunctional 4-hydroxy-3-methylbut-2-enyl diphosphate reductase/30S ribosomal protein S1 [Clostridiales bacterium]|nr:bifunctional 4-hydroxy-3-methylbut-2-enyl diphosphate reductase/30S ribosomal protein S1 [Clostridiales bacterium]